MGHRHERTANNEFIEKIANEMRSLSRLQKELEFWLAYSGPLLQTHPERLNFVIHTIAEERRKAQERVDLWHVMLDRRNGSRPAPDATIRI